MSEFGNMAAASKNFAAEAKPGVGDASDSAGNEKPMKGCDDVLDCVHETPPEESGVLQIALPLSLI